MAETSTREPQSVAHGSVHCTICSYPHVDLCLTGCGCSFHVACLPVDLLTTANDQPCTFCGSASSTGLYIVPLSFESLDKSILLRTKQISSSSGGTGQPTSGTSSGRKDTSTELDANLVRATNDVYSLVKPSLNAGLRDLEGSGRTGRWKEDEVHFVDQLVCLFDNGQLPLPDGTKLGSFLADILLCRTSRLTKKMKKARLSAREFKRKNISNERDTRTKKDFEFLSMLQEKFVESVSEESTQLEIRFNLTRQWRTYFLELCLQLGCSNIKAGDWVASVDDFDKRVSVAKEQLLSLGRRLIHSSFQNSTSVDAKLPISTSATCEDTASVSTSSSNHSEDRSVASARIQHYIHPKREMDHPEKNVAGPFDEHVFEERPTKRVRSGSVDLDAEFLGLMQNEVGDLIDDGSIIGDDESISNKIEEVYNSNSIPRAIALPSEPKTFPEVVAAFMQSYDLPFDYADVWVPSCAQENILPSFQHRSAIRLISAGHATRKDQLGSAALENFGEYSQSFSFNIGCGLPGRVYSTGKARWEYKICDSDPGFFLRAQGAKAHGIKTAVGIPFNTPELGKMVVVFYSRKDLTEDSSLETLCLAGLSKYSPKPKWELVVEKGQSQDDYNSFSFYEGELGAPFALLPPAPIGYSNKPTAEVATKGSGSERASLSSSDSVDETLQELISLLGEQLAVFPGFGSSSEQSVEMSRLRLFLLRPASRMSQEEIGTVSILKDSYINYTKDNKRSKSEIAVLLAREWAALQSPQKGSQQSYRRYIMEPVMSRAVVFKPSSLARPGLSPLLITPNSNPTDNVVHYNHNRIQQDLNFTSIKDHTDTNKSSNCAQTWITSFRDSRCRSVSDQSMTNDLSKTGMEPSVGAGSISSMEISFPFKVFQYESGPLDF